MTVRKAKAEAVRKRTAKSIKRPKASPSRAFGSEVNVDTLVKKTGGFPIMPKHPKNPFSSLVVAVEKQIDDYLTHANSLITTTGKRPVTHLDVLDLGTDLSKLLKSLTRVEETATTWNQEGNKASSACRDIGYGMGNLTTQLRLELIKRGQFPVESGGKVVQQIRNRHWTAFNRLLKSFYQAAAAFRDQIAKARTQLLTIPAAKRPK